MKVLASFVALMTLVIASTAAAHHSSAMFDPAKLVTLTGDVKELQWTNPHSWIELMVTDGDGKSVQWSIEMDGPNSMVRQGWKPHTVSAGDHITVVAHPLRDGRPGGTYVAIELPDGKRLGDNTLLPAK